MRLRRFGWLVRRSCHRLRFFDWRSGRCSAFSRFWYGRGSGLRRSGYGRLGRAPRSGRLRGARHNPPLRLVIIGAVHIAQSVIPIAQALGYDITVIDPRGAFATGARFPGIALHAEWPDEVIPQLRLDSRTAMMALTHDPKIDDPALAAALRSEVFYIGALGSKKTQGSRAQRLKDNAATTPGRRCPARARRPGNQ